MKRRDGIRVRDAAGVRDGGGYRHQLYMEMPRVAFESQRQREHLLIARGEQYKRGIQLFYRKYHTYPQTLDDLETTQEHSLPAPAL